MERIPFVTALPSAYAAFHRLQTILDEGSLPPLLVELVKLRVSQLNGCTFCLDKHSKDARAMGEAEQRLHLLAGWREAPCYTEAERAALAWAEAVTLLPTSSVPDEIYEELSRHFSEVEIVELTWQLVAINGWNRLAVSMRSPVGGYISRRRPPGTGAARLGGTSRAGAPPDL